jgi:hypothetical protein
VTPLLYLAALVAAVSTGVPGSVGLPGSVTTHRHAGDGSSQVAVWVSPLGNDSTCSRGVQSLPCATFARAYQVARQGDVVSVAPGEYAVGNPAINDDPSKTVDGSYVTFECASAAPENVTFNVADFIIYGDHVKIDGGGNWRTGTPSCMRFQSIWTGVTGGLGYATDTIITGVHAQSVEALGAHTLIVQSSELGPSVACQNQEWPDASQRCQNDPTTGEAWYYSHDQANCGNRSANNLGWSATATNPSSSVTFTSDWIHDYQTRDAAHCHNGGMANFGAVNGVTISRNKFEQNIVYDLFLDGSLSNVTIENNWLGSNVNAFASGCSYHTCTVVQNGLGIELDDNHGATTYTNWLVRFNTMSGGNSLGHATTTNTYNNVRWIGNLEAAFDCAKSTGMTVDYNVIVGTTCGSNGKKILKWPFSSTPEAAVDFSLMPGGWYAFRALVPATQFDYRAMRDFGGTLRSYPTTAGAVQMPMPLTKSKPANKRKRRLAQPGR